MNTEQIDMINKAEALKESIIADDMELTRLNQEYLKKTHEANQKFETLRRTIGAEEASKWLQERLKK